MGFEKASKAVVRHFWWPGFYQYVRDYIQACESCQRNKTSHQKSAGLLQPLQHPDHKWTDISLDFITQLPRTQSGYDAILVVVDRCTKMCHFIPTHTTCDAEQMAQLFVDNIYRLHGLPDSLVADRDSRLTGNFMKEFCERLMIKLRLFTTYHPQTDGQTERMNRVLEEMLRHFVGPDQDDWDKYLSHCEFAVNNHCISGTDVTLFFLNSGTNPRVAMVQFAKGLDGAGNRTAQKMTRDMQDALVTARAYFQKAQQRAWQYANQHRREEVFQVRDKVLLNTRNLKERGKSMNKFMKKFTCPFEVIKKIGAVSYKLRLPDQMKNFPVFHVSLLKRYHGDPSRQPASNPQE